MTWVSTTAIIIYASVASVAAAGVSAYSSYQQGQAMAAQSAYNAEIARRNAALAAQKGQLTKSSTNLEADKFQRQTRFMKAAQETAYAKAGVQMAGTPLMVTAETQRQADIDELAIRYAGSVELSNVIAEQAKQEQNAKLFKMQGSQYKTAGDLGAASSLLSGLGNAGSQGVASYAALH